MTPDIYRRRDLNSPVSADSAWSKPCWDRVGSGREGTKGIGTEKRNCLEGLLLAAAILSVTSLSMMSPVLADATPTYCTITNVHVSSTTPTDGSSTVVQVTTTFSLYCSGDANTVWSIQTKVFAQSSLVGTSSISSSTNQYSPSQGTADYVVHNQFDAMNYYGYGEQSPSFYVQVTVTNLSTGSLDAQQQAPFAVDTSQYPFDITQQNYCHFPALAPYFQLLPGCGGSSNYSLSNNSASSNCNLYGLPQFLQPYLPGCSGTSNTSSPTTSMTTTQTANSPLPGSPLVTSPKQATTPQTITSFNSEAPAQAILSITIAALAAFLGIAGFLRKSDRLHISRDYVRLKPLGKYCTECGLRLHPDAIRCERCGESCADTQETITFKLQ